MRAGLDEGSTYAVSGAILAGGRASWVSEPVTIDIARPVLDLGLIMLEPYTALAFVTRWTCGAEPVSVGYAGDQAILMVGGDSIPVQPVPSASGVRYDAGLDPGTFIWSKGDRAMLQVRGRPYPECTHVAARRP
jgi:membrane-bound inhibitor of C-type lysozyme